MSHSHTGPALNLSIGIHSRISPNDSFSSRYVLNLVLHVVRTNLVLSINLVHL
eukprot:SAG31_NODE_159_length_21911_cov_12.220750_15_plen_53_part_00